MVDTLKEGTPTVVVEEEEAEAAPASTKTTSNAINATRWVTSKMNVPHGKGMQTTQSWKRTCF